VPEGGDGEGDDPPPPPQPVQSAATSRQAASTTTAAGFKRGMRPSLRLAPRPSIKTALVTNQTPKGSREIGGIGRLLSGARTARAVVVTVTVAVAGFVPSGVTEVGETAHPGLCDTKGLTEHVRFTG
jgi:hypothetical protein